MTRLFFFFALVSLMGLLAACGATMPVQPTTTLTVTKMVIVAPSADLVADCDVNAVPPDPTIYAKASDAEQNTMLKKYSVAQQADFTACAARPKIQRDWYAKQAKIYNAVPASAPSP